MRGRVNFVTMSSMKVLSSERGAINILLIPLIVSVVLLFASMGFGVWAFASRLDYKNHTDQKIEAAVKVTEAQTSTAKDNEFEQEFKKPLTSYTGSESLGNIKFEYPKTWSMYEVVSGNSISLTMHPVRIPSNPATAYALRVEVVSSPYEREIGGFDPGVKDGSIKATAYSLKQVPDAVGTRFEGKISGDKQGVYVVLPLRDKSIKIWTESPQYIADLDNYVLSNFTFKP